MRPRRSVEDWRRAVYKARTISDKTRVLLLWLADRMTADRKVSVPREHVATALGISERRVTERVTEAHKAGLLVTVVRGQKGRTATYQAAFGRPVQRDSTSPPENAFSGTSTSPLMRDSMSPPETGFSGTDVRPTITTADLTARVTESDVGSYEEHEGPDAASRLPESGWPR